MRIASLLVVVAAGCSCPGFDREPGEVPTETGRRYISIGTDALATAHSIAWSDGAQLEVFATDDADIAVLAIDAAELEALSTAMHEQHDRCGGFILHESLEEALASAHPDAARPAIDYTLDRAAAVQTVLPALDRSRILETIRELSAMKTRHYQSETGAAASVWLQDRWRSFTTRPDVTVELFDHGFPQKSVILTIPGTIRPSEIVVIGGHLDSIVLRGTKASTSPGADDDASGIATLTEVARVLLANDFRPERTVKFMAYAAEEVGLRGSQGIVRDYKQRNLNVVGVMQLDMTNYQGSEKDIWLMKDFTNAAQNTFVTQLIDTYVGATWGLDACGYGCSDHASWYRAGVPASMPFESRMSQHNRSIHTHKDTLETSRNNADHAIKFARLGAAFALELAKGDVNPPASAAAVIAPVTEDSASAWELFALAALALGGLWIARTREVA